MREIPFGIKATLSDITVKFTPDEWPRYAKLIDFVVKHVEEINARGEVEPLKSRWLEEMQAITKPPNLS